MIKAWHFTGDKLRDGSPIPPIGEWLEFNGPVKICESGLHASRDPFDALKYAPGTILHLVECDQIVEEHDDKLVCRRRRIIASKDATEGIRYFARMRALSVVHLWNAPDVVLDFLMTGDETIREAAEAAAWAAEAFSFDAAAWAAADAAWAAAAGAGRASAAWAAARAGAATAAARQEFNALVAEAFE